MDKLFKKYNKVTFISHNMRKFDLRVLHLLPVLFNKQFLGQRMKKAMVDKVFYLKYESKDHYKVIQFIDSLNLFKTKLEDLAEMFGMEKEDIKEYKLSAEEWNKQLLRTGKSRVQKDTEILYRVIEAFLKIKYFNPSLTIASTSFNTFKRDFLKYDITFPKKYLDIAISTYHGGTVMPYQLIENQEATMLDINSLYPTVMKKNPSSIRFRTIREDKKYLFDDIKNNTYNYLALVRYNANEILHSPVYTYYDNQLIPFLSGYQWITGNELLALYENNFTIGIEKILEFENDYIFTDFVDFFYSRRLKAKNDFEKYFYKIILNSLYGKFAQHKGYSEIMKISEIDNPMIKEILEQTEQSKEIINGQVYSIYEDFVSVMKEGKAKYNPLIASEITANARLVNYQYSQMIGWENLFYTDTDSFLTNKHYPLLLGNELGQLKEEKKGLFTVNAPKDYQYYGICINKKDCEICHGKDEGMHYVIKGVNDFSMIEENMYINKRWSGIKYKTNNDIYIEYALQSLKRNNKKMKYDNKIGKEWESIKEYNQYYGINDNSYILSVLNLRLP